MLKMFYFRNTMNDISEIFSTQKVPPACWNHVQRGLRSVLMKPLNMLNYPKTVEKYEVSFRSKSV